MKPSLEKALFLDFDGVLLSKQGHIYWDSQKARGLPSKRSMYEQFCPIAVSNLNLIAEHIPNLSIVLSTSWRKGVMQNEMGDPIAVLGGELEKAGFAHKDLIHSITPVFEHFGKRREEINAWFNEYRCDSYVILDDIENLGQRHVFCDDRVGLDFPTLLKVFEMFEVETPISWVA